MRLLAIRLAATFLVAAPALAWPFQPLVLNFEEGTRLDSVAKRGDKLPTITAPTGGGTRTFMFTTDEGSQFDVSFSPDAAEGRRSLAFKLSSKQDLNVKDKIMMNVVGAKDAERLRIGPGGARYLSFDFKLDPNYEVPRFWSMHLQARQCCGGGLHPPFTMQVVPAKDKKAEVELRFLVRNDANVHADEGQEIHRMKIPRGQWNNMALRLEPGKAGRLSMWYNGAQQFDYRGDWGFSPGGERRKGKTGGRATTTTEDMYVSIGTYRRRSASTQVILFDNVRYGDSQESVARSAR